MSSSRAPSLPPAPSHEVTRGASRKRTPSWVYISPLGFAFLPLILRINHPMKQQIFVGACALGVMHGFALITSSYDYKEKD